jgi:hypothetical protein
MEFASKVEFTCKSGIFPENFINKSLREKIEFVVLRFFGSLNTKLTLSKL